jgi:hypothetical protein
MQEDTSREPRMDRHSTHRSGQLHYKGRRGIHGGNAIRVLMGRMTCDVYVCGTCDHIAFFYPSDPM